MVPLLWVGNVLLRIRIRIRLSVLMSIRIRIGSYPRFYGTVHIIEIKKFFFTFIHSRASLPVYTILTFFSAYRVPGRCQKYFGRYIKFSGKKYSLALHLMEIDTDPDWKALDADPDPAK